MTDSEIRQLAVDIHEGRVFTSWHCRDLMTLENSFLILGLLSESNKKAIKKDSYPGFCYEYLKDALPRAVNGNPMFISVRFLPKGDFYERLDQYLRELQEFKRQFVGEVIS